MLSTYKEKIVKEIRRVPDDKMPKLYRVIPLLTAELMSEGKIRPSRLLERDVEREPD